MRVVIAYDIRNDDERATVAAILSGHGVRVQKSVFDCMVPTANLPEVVELIQRHLDADRDTLHVFPQCDACCERRIEWGQVDRTMGEHFWIV